MEAVAGGTADQEFVETMTLAGQKVETYERLDGELRNVVERLVILCENTITVDDVKMYANGLQ